MRHSSLLFHAAPSVCKSWRVSARERAGGGGGASLALRSAAAELELEGTEREVEGPKYAAKANAGGGAGGLELELKLELDAADDAGALVTAGNTASITRVMTPLRRIRSNAPPSELLPPTEVEVGLRLPSREWDLPSALGDS